MKLAELLSASDDQAAQIIARGNVLEQLMVAGTWHFNCVRDGEVIWEDTVKNTVMTAGKNHLLDNYLNTSAFTQTGPMLGMISSVSYSAINATDTSASHSGWLEAGSANAPTWSTPGSGARINCNGLFSAASAGAKALSAAQSFTMSGSGTLKGAAMWLGSGAVVTNASTAGTLFSAGLFTGGDRSVINLDVVNASWSLAV
jgi:hypothetical protein